MEKLRKLPIRYQLLILAISTFLVMAILFLYNYYQNAGLIVKRNKEYTTETMLQMKQNISVYCRNIEKILTSIAYTRMVQDYVAEKDPLVKFNLDQQISSLLSNTQYLADGIVDIVIIGRTGNYASINGNVEFVKKYERQFQNKTAPYFSELIEMDYQRSKLSVFIAGITFKSIYSSENKPIGSCYILINAAKINTYRPNQNGGEQSNTFYLTDKKDRVFSSNTPAPIGVKVKLATSGKLHDFVQKSHGGNNYIEYDRLPAIGGKIICVTPEKKLFAELFKIRKTVLALFGLSFILLSFPYGIIMNNILSPLKQVMRFINEYPTDHHPLDHNPSDFNKRINLEGYAEITAVAHEFNHMLGEIEVLTKRLIETNTRLYQTELEKKEAELSFLQSQVNPHFLYNTLETIKGIASVKGIPEIRDMTKALGQIFQYSVKGMDEVVLQDELNMVQAYLQIQKIRFPNRFLVEYHFEETLLDCLVPKMILQPIVENAIYHGLEMVASQGLLQLIIAVRDEQLILKVADNGPGIPKEKLAQIQKKLASNVTGDGRSHIGIINVHNRIRLIYGTAYGVSINSGIGEGTEVVIAAPVRRASLV